METRAEHCPHITAIVVLACLAITTIIINDRSTEFLEFISRFGSIQYPEFLFAAKDERHRNFSTTEKWIVMRANTESLQSIKQYTALSGFQIVVVGIEDLPENGTIPGVHYLSTKDQESLGYRITKHIPFNSYSRINVGHLYAIQNGAQMIYELEEGISLYPFDKNKTFFLDINKSSITQILMISSQSSQHVINPYIQFGQQSVWPRGLPLPSIAQNRPRRGCHTNPHHFRPLIQASLVDNGPDIDALFKLTSKLGRSESTVSFDRSAPPVGIDPGRFTPFNSKNTLFHHDVFWGLFLPINSEMSDIVRSYWVQALLPEVSGFVAVLPPSAFQKRKQLSKYHSFLNETDSYRSFPSLIAFLSNWESDKANILDRSLELLTAMAANGLVDKRDVQLLHAWQLDLKSVGYTPPQTAMAKKALNGELPGQPVMPNATAPGLQQGGSELKCRLQSLFQLQRLRRHFSGIVLIINFNHARHVPSSIDFWTVLYSRMFSRIEYVSHRGVKGYDIATYPYPSKAVPGFFAYKAIGAIVARHPKAKGFLWTNDDVVLNYWNLLEADPAKVWFIPPSQWSIHPPGFGEIEPYPYYSNNSYCKGGDWYCQYLPQLTQAIRGLGSKYEAMLKASLGVKKISAVKALADVFYFPARLAEPFVSVLASCAEFELRSEMVVGTALCAVERRGDFDGGALRDFAYLWSKDRAVSHLLQVYSPIMAGLHPWKVNSNGSRDALFRLLMAGDLTL